MFTLKFEKVLFWLCHPTTRFTKLISLIHPSSVFKLFISAILAPLHLITTPFSSFIQNFLPLVVVSNLAPTLDQELHRTRLPVEDFHPYHPLEWNQIGVLHNTTARTIVPRWCPVVGVAILQINWRATSNKEWNSKRIIWGESANICAETVVGIRTGLSVSFR